jgi:hypothetical protein
MAKKGRVSATQSAGPLPPSKTFKAYAENHFDKKIKAMQDDKAGEYMSKDFIKFTDSCGIERRHTTRNRPQQNGVAERANRTMADDITAMLTESNLPASFWEYCLAAHIHVWNRLPTAVAPKTPHLGWYGTKPAVGHLRVWGCTAYVYIQRDKRKSLQPHMEKCVFIGYPAGYKGWLFYNPTTKKTIISERAEFDERYFPGLRAPPRPSAPPPPLPTIDLTVKPDNEDSDVYSGLDFGGDDSDDSDEPNPVPMQTAPAPAPPAAVPAPLPAPPPAPPLRPSRTAPSNATPARTRLRSQQPPTSQHNINVPPIDPANYPLPNNDHDPDLDGPVLPRKSTRVSKPPGAWWKVSREPAPVIDDSDEEVNFAFGEMDEDGFEEIEFAGAASGPEPDPRTYKLAMKSKDADKWKIAADEEMTSLTNNDTWDVVDLPPGQKAIGSGWVFKVKRNADGSVERYKGRIVAKGCGQRPGIDYNEVFAPTFRPAALRLILAIAGIEDMELRSVDITSAFPNGDLEEDIYMRPPDGYNYGGVR